MALATFRRQQQDNILTAYMQTHALLYNIKCFGQNYVPLIKQSHSLLLTVQDV